MALQLALVDRNPLLALFFKIWLMYYVLLSNYRRQGYANVLIHRILLLPLPKRLCFLVACIRLLVCLFAAKQLQSCHQILKKFSRNDDNNTRNRYIFILDVINITIWKQESLKGFLSLHSEAILDVLYLGRGMVSPSAIVPRILFMYSSYMKISQFSKKNF